MADINDLCPICAAPQPGVPYCPEHNPAPRPSIEVSEHGGITCRGEGITMFRLLALRGAVKLEAVGLRRRGPSASSIAKKELGLGRNAKPAAVLAALQAAIDAQQAKL